MAVVVIGIMFAFIGGSALQHFLEGGKTGLHRTIAYFADDRKITNYDLYVLARRELEILRRLGADTMLRSIIEPVSRTPDLRMLLLSELLFSERQTSPESIMRIKQTIRSNGYRISDKQINDIYRRSVPADCYWLLLENEAQLAGVRISNKNSGSQLARIIPQLFPGATYSQLIGSIVNRQGIPEDQILTTFGKLLAVSEYANVICSGENATSAQIMQTISQEEERIDVEFVKFDSTVFTGLAAETQEEPTEEKISAHFDRYKRFFAGAVSGENPYGFGYKLADRVRLEYIAVKLDDVSGIVTPPTQDEAQEYYRRNEEQFKEQVLSDPNDPNSPLTERSKTYAEVASIISKALLQNKINSKAEKILQEAGTLTEDGLQETDISSGNLSAEQLKAMSGDYESTADQLSKKYNVRVYAGQTGLFDAVDVQTDRHLGMLYLQRHGYNPVGLTQVVFALDELGASELGPFDVPKPRMYENIGPMKDMFGQTMVVVRVIEAKKASEPESINQTFSKETLRLETGDKQASEDVYSVREKVAEDLKKLAAMDTVKSKAEEFITLAAKDGWESTIEKFNELYGEKEQPDKGDPNATGDPNVIKGVGEQPFKLQNLSGLQRISKEVIGTLAVQSAGNPVARPSVEGAKKEALFREQLYSLVPQDSNTVETLPLVMEFKPDLSYYCLKGISVKRLERQEYEKIKTIRVYKEDAVQSQSLAVVHFNPENILKRMNFRWAEEVETATDVNAPEDANAPQQDRGQKTEDGKQSPER